MSGKGGVDKVAGGGGDSDEELVRGEGGYNGGSAAEGVSGEARGSGTVRRGVGGYERDAEAGNGGGPQEEVSVKNRVEILERKIKELEGRLKETKSEEVEFVDRKQMRPNVPKDGTTFRVWREEYERWSGLKLKGMQEVLKWLG